MVKLWVFDDKQRIGERIESNVRQHWDAMDIEIVKYVALALDRIEQMVDGDVATLDSQMPVTPGGVPNVDAGRIIFEKINRQRKRILVLWHSDANRPLALINAGVRKVNLEEELTSSLREWLGSVEKWRVQEPEEYRSNVVSEPLESIAKDLQYDPGLYDALNALFILCQGFLGVHTDDQGQLIDGLGNEETYAACRVALEIMKCRELRIQGETVFQGNALARQAVRERSWWRTPFDGQRPNLEVLRAKRDVKAQPALDALLDDIFGLPGESISLSNSKIDAGRVARALSEISSVLPRISA